MNRRLPIAFAALLALTAAGPAWAWSTTPMPGGMSSGSNLSDPDDQVEAMTGRSDDGGTSGRSNYMMSPRSDDRSSGGWSFSVGGSNTSDRDSLPYGHALSNERPGRW